VDEMKNKKLALFLPSLHGGGAERVMLNLAKGFSERGIQVDLVLAKAEGPYLSQVPKEVRIVNLKASRTLYSLPQLVKYLRHERPRALLSTLYHANIIAVWAKMLARFPVYLVLREAITTSLLTRMERNILGMLIIKFLIKVFYRYANVVVAVSQGVADDLRKFAMIPETKNQVIYNPVDISNISIKAAESPEHPWFNTDKIPVILGVGRLDPQKDFETLIKAFAIVRKSWQARLVILGEGKERPRLEKLIKDLNLEKDISLPGFVNNPYKYIKRASLFVLSSRFEGFPNVLVEALALGTPVVSTNCPSGPAEILENGKWGRLVPVGDVKALADAIIKTLNDNVDKKALQERARDFSLERIVPMYLEVLGMNERLL
jgi:glycosyltransferase involved in cell wall biosynthesis